MRALVSAVTGIGMLEYPLGVVGRVVKHNVDHADHALVPHGVHHHLHALYARAVRDAARVFEEIVVDLHLVG